MNRLERLAAAVAASFWLCSAPLGAMAQTDEQGSEQAEQEDDVDPAMTAAGEQLDDDAARTHFVAAQNLYDVGRFVEAAREFEEAHRLSGRAELLYNVYIAYRDAGQSPEAAENLRRYLDEMPEAPDRVNLQARLRVLEQQVAEQQQAEQAAAARAPVQESPEAGSEGPPSNQWVADEGPGMTPWIVAGAGGALVLGGVVTGVLALGATSSLEDDCPNDVCTSDYDLDGESSSARTLATVADVLLIGGALVAAGGLTWALLTSGSGGSEQPMATAGCDANGCAAEVRVAF